MFCTETVHERKAFIIYGPGELIQPLIQTILKQQDFKVYVPQPKLKSLLQIQTACTNMLHKNTS